MPTYDYYCTECAHELEAFHAMSAPPLTECPVCGKSTLKRKIGTGAGLLFKGSGFYTTDYRSDSYKDAAKQDKPAAKKEGSGSGGEKKESKVSEPAAKKPPAKTTE